MDSRFKQAGAPGVLLQSASDDCGEDPSGRVHIAQSASEFLWVAIPRVLSAALQLGINLLIVRQLGPELSGVVFVCITAIILGDAILGSAFDVAVIRLGTAQHSDAAPDALEIQWAAVVLKMAGCVVLGVPVAIWATSLSLLLFQNDKDANLLLLSVAALFGLLLLRSVQTGFQIGRRFVLYGITDLLHSCVKFGGIGVLLGLSQLTPFAILTLYAAGPLFTSLIMLATSSRDILRARLSKRALRSLFGLFKWYAGGAAAGSMTSRMDIFLVSALAGSLQTGLFAAAQTLTIPFQMLGMYMGVVLAPRIMPLWEKGKLLPVYSSFQASVIALCLVCYIAALATAHTVPAWLLPASFKGTTLTVILLLPAYLTALVNFPWTVSFLMFTHPRFLMIFDTCALFVLGILYWKCIVRYGAAGAAAVTSLYAIVKTVVFQCLALATLRKQPRAIDDRALTAAAGTGQGIPESSRSQYA